MAKVEARPGAQAPHIAQQLAPYAPGSVVNGPGRRLISLDGGPHKSSLLHQLRIGAQTKPAALSASALPKGSLLVASPDDAIKAITHARPGDVITLLPGIYRFSGRSISVSQAGSEKNRITVRGARLDSVFLEFDITEGFHVSAPFWTFENLDIRGVCRDHSSCEHAFHIVGKASHFTARNNRITDFNAHFKINGSGDNAPDHGIIEGNTLTNRTVRQTENPVTPIDMVAASHWIIRGNLISDFVKGYGNQISYGAFAKGGGSDNRFEGNAVLCEHFLRGAPGHRVGISFGNGGTGKQYCRDKRCVTEQDSSIIQSNLIAFCSDDGIYLISSPP